MDKKEFALQEIAPYYKDPSICGYNETTEKCMNLTTDGRMCVAGKNLLPRLKTVGSSLDINGILFENGSNQSNVFIPEVVGILTNYEWERLQKIHDAIAVKKPEYILIERINTLGLFTFEELKEYVK